MKRVALKAVAAGLFALVAVVAGLVIRRQGTPRRVALSDGSQIEVRAMIPSEQNFSTEKPWERQLRRVLPPRTVAWLPTPTSGRCGSGSNAATLYVAVESTGPAGALPWSNYFAEDDEGFRYPMEGGYCSFGGGIGGGAKIFGLTLRAFPRRQKDFVVRFRAPNEADVGELRISSPFSGPFPQWKADPLPITVTNGPVALTLEACAVAGEPRWRYLKPTWQLKATDPLWAKARAGFPTLADATGNEGSILSPREPVWRVRTAVHRQRHEDFRPEERMVFEGLGVPQPGGFVVVNQKLEQTGVSVRLRAIADAGTLYLTNDVPGVLGPGQSSGHGISSDGQTVVEHWSSDRAFLLLETKGVRWEDETRLRLTDQAGNEVKVEDSAGSTGAANGGIMRQWKLTLPTNTTALSLEVIVSRPLTFDFFVNPRDAQGAARLERKQ